MRRRRQGPDDGVQPTEVEKVTTVLKKLDMYPKVESEWKVTTTTGGYLSLVGVLFTVILTLSEVVTYWWVAPQCMFASGALPPFSHLPRLCVRTKGLPSAQPESTWWWTRPSGQS